MSFADLSLTNILNNIVQRLTSPEVIQSANILWQGMLGIFIVMIIISLIVYILSKITH